MSLPSFTSHEWRRGFAFIGVWGGCVATLGYICWLTWLLRHDADKLFWLAKAANGQLFLGMLTLAWFGGRRMMLNLTRDGFSIDDRGSPADPPDLPQPTFGQGG